MAYNEKTSYLSLPLPHPRNTLREDCPRIRESLQGLDDFAKKTDESLSRLSAADMSLNQAIQRQQEATAQALSEEKTERANADSALDEVIATLQSQLASLAETVSKINPWDIFPMRVPIAVDGITFLELEKTRPVLDETGQPAVGEDGEPLTETVTVQDRHPIMPGETEPRANWIVCDGGDDGQGGTVPDLRGRMILGASESRPAGESGGSEEHTHSLSGTVGATTLSVAQLAAHNHGFRVSLNGAKGSTTYAPDGGGNADNAVVLTNGSSQPHTHSLSGASGATSNFAPYYALTFVMRIA